MTAHAPPPPAPPIGLLVELTHRCPLGCLYCSNPLALERPGAELDAETWKRVFSEAAALGALHVHLSGGEPTARRDIVDLKNPFRREQRPSPPRFVTLEPHSFREMRPRLSVDPRCLVHLQSGRNAPGGIAPST